MAKKHAASRALKAGPEQIGVLELTGRGYGFVLPDDRPEGNGKSSRDILVERADLHGALHGDRVAVRITAFRKGRREGVIVRVLERAWKRLCGICEATPAGGLVQPDNERLPRAFTVATGGLAAAEADGLAVVAEIVDYGDGGAHDTPRCRITEILGDPLDARVQLRMACLGANAPETFAPEVLAEADQLAGVTEPGPDREDQRHLPFVTIDGEDARDFDDAICVIAEEAGFTLHVAIADVSHYVRPGSLLDAEAYRRGTSIYLPGRVMPMLPERLSNGLCSLMPNQPRPAFTATLHFDREGRRTGARFRKSLMQSRRRCTYTEVQALLFPGAGAADPGLEREFAAASPELPNMLRTARDLVALLKARRLERGGLEFDAPESEAILEEGRVVAMRRAGRNQAHMLIEDCMLAANEAVAETLAKARRPLLFRIHEEPDAEKLAVFAETVRRLGLPLPGLCPDIGRIAAILDKVAATPHAYMVNNLLLRSLPQARYSPDNAGHFGLGAEHYAHFTSPIRRYPDLVLHRLVQAWLEGADTPADAAGGADLAEAGRHLSQCERRAIELERNALARMAALFLYNRRGERFFAVISGLNSQNLFLDLEESGIGGAVPVTHLPDDYYLYDTRRHRLMGERRGMIFQLGDRVEARLEEVDLMTRRITFSLEKRD